MSNLFDLSGKTAVVTGGGSGIGLAMASALAHAGAQVSLWGRRADVLDRAAASLASAPGAVSTRVVDVSDEAAVVAAMAAEAEELGGLDILVANAGAGFGRERLTDATTEVWDKTLGINLTGAFWTIREAAKAMLSGGQPGGSIIAIASVAAVDGAAQNHAYGVTKAGLTALVRSSAVELGRKGVRVNAVLPGWIATDMTEGLQGSDAFQNNVISRVPAGRWGKPEDFEGIAVYLASDASSFQTGTTVVIDGGYTIY